ncbi:probable lactoylglutathione lyase, chloroplastic isoform X4 [Lycium ferocissimum]|uniref:probable lactoylglutathione lyase, chloroplastic isoform X4 n=1 Tax=Lycium ferocissimum TaxID=112874 RepID=UPI002816492C|nr:probable lactoylglutathione lyase, chloroplastic isoform X4 [Lycium ferocissimum]
MALQIFSPKIQQPLKSIFPSSTNNGCSVFVPCAYNASRRLALFQLTTAITQSQLFNGKAPESLNAEGKVIESGTIAELAQSNIALSDENASEWIKQDKRRMLHVVYRVGDLDKTIKFYAECLGMKLLRRRDIPEDGYSNAFLGYGPEESNFAVELTYNYGVEKYDIGTGFGHFGIAVEDVAKMVDLVKAKGGKVLREPGPIKDGGPIIALVEDPDGYNFEFLERSPTLEPFRHVMLRVGDLDQSINFYKKNTIAIMGYGPEDQNAVLELTYIYGVKSYDKGNGYGQTSENSIDISL